VLKRFELRTGGGRASRGGQLGAVEVSGPTVQRRELASREGDEVCWWGDATLATRNKGETLAEAMAVGMLAEIETLRSSPLPAATP